MQEQLPLLSRKVFFKFFCAKFFAQEGKINDEMKSFTFTEIGIDLDVSCAAVRSTCGAVNVTKLVTHRRNGIEEIRLWNSLLGWLRVCGTSTKLREPVSEKSQRGSLELFTTLPAVYTQE